MLQTDQCTVVKKGIIIEILDFELRSFLEGLGFMTNDYPKAHYFLLITNPKPSKKTLTENLRFLSLYPSAIIDNYCAL